jgi:muramoyltetrapeptide carboxypeptidase
MVVFYGPMAYSSLPENRFDEDNLKKILTGDYTAIDFPGAVLGPGKVKGTVTGGCLSNLVSLLGTPYFPNVRQRILLLEDVGERPYRLDRMFWQLASAGIFSQIRGLLLGQFPHCYHDEKEKQTFLNRVRFYLNQSGRDIPVIYDLPIGHCDRIHILPLGIEVEIDTTRFRGFSINETCVR